MRTAQGDATAVIDGGGSNEVKRVRMRTSWYEDRDCWLTGSVIYPCQRLEVDGRAICTAGGEDAAAAVVVGCITVKIDCLVEHASKCARAAATRIDVRCRIVVKRRRIGATDNGIHASHGECRARVEVERSSVHTRFERIEATQIRAIARRIIVVCPRIRATRRWKPAIAIQTGNRIVIDRALHNTTHLLAAAIVEIRRRVKI